MVVILNEQDIVDSICLTVSNRHRFGPEDVEVTLEPKSIGFVAEIEDPRGFRTLGPEEISDCVRVYMNNEFNMNPDMMNVNLEIEQDKSFVAIINFD